MEEACKVVEKTVNDEMRKRNRFPLEWGGDPGDPDGRGLTWRANFAAANCYEGAKEGVGFHSDRLTTIGPYPTIASLSLGTSKLFFGCFFFFFGSGGEMARCRNAKGVSPPGGHRP
jgi:hypothetical protein